MIKNYFKIAIKVLKRNKLYTFISLFGISFTLMVLMLAAAILDNEIGNNAPLSKGDRILFVPQIEGLKYAREKKVTYDTTFVNGVERIDSTETLEINKEATGGSMASGPLSISFYKNNLTNLKTPHLVSLFIDNSTTEVFFPNSKLVLNGNLTDFNYWKIFDFNFLEGKPFTEKSVDNQSNEVILKESTARKYFGDQKSYLGKEVELANLGKFKIIGIVRDPSTNIRYVNADYFIPFSWAKESDLEYDFLKDLGSCKTAFLLENQKDVKNLEAEFRILENNLKVFADFDRWTILEKDVSDIYAWSFFGHQGLRYGNKFLTILTIVLFVFLLIPIFNLINLNVTRIYERASEIGVRKAFGAKTSNLFVQFLFENLLITFLGGLLGFLFSLIVLDMFNKMEVLGEAKMKINYKVFSISIFMTFMFGVLAGILPAIRIAKISIVKALNSGKL